MRVNRPQCTAKTKNMRVFTGGVWGWMAGQRTQALVRAGCVELQKPAVFCSCREFGKECMLPKLIKREFHSDPQAHIAVISLRAERWRDLTLPTVTRAYSPLLSSAPNRVLPDTCICGPYKASSLGLHALSPYPYRGGIQLQRIDNILILYKCGKCVAIAEACTRVRRRPKLFSRLRLPQGKAVR